MISLKVVGIDFARRALARYGKATVRATEQAKEEIAEEILTDARQNAPHDTGDLRASLTKRRSAGGFTVGSDLPYAWIQHEDLTFRHATGGPKYLENAVVRARGRIAAKIRAKLRRVK